MANNQIVAINKQKVPIWPAAGYVKNNEMWLAHGNLSMLFKFNMANKYADYVCSLQDEPLVRENAVKELIGVDTGIYIIPLWGNHVHFYDFNNKKEMIINIPDENVYSGKLLFSKALLFDGTIYLIPQNYPYILSINPELNKIDIEFRIGEFLSDIGIDTININAADTDEAGNIYCMITSTNKIIKYSIVSHKAEVIDVGANKKYDYLAICDSKIFLAPSEECVVDILDSKNIKVTETISIPFKNFTIKKIFGDKLLFDSYSNEEYAIWNGLEVFPYRSPQKINNEYTFYGGVLISGDDNKFYYYDRCSYELKGIRENGEISEKGKKIISEIDLNLINLPGDGVMTENSVLGLEWLIGNLREEG